MPSASSRKAIAPNSGQCSCPRREGPSQSRTSARGAGRSRARRHALACAGAYLATVAAVRRLLASLAVAAAALLCAGPAWALPGDPPVTPIAPADGASLPTSSAGIPVSYACPLYRTSDFGDGIVRTGDESYYTVLLSGRPRWTARAALPPRKRAARGPPPRPTRTCATCCCAPTSRPPRRSRRGSGTGRSRGSARGARRSSRPGRSVLHARVEREADALPARARVRGLRVHRDRRREGGAHQAPR